MSNSSLISHTKLSPNCTSPRTKKIDTISIHCMAGDMTIESCGNFFAQSKTQASSNYGIGSDGRIALYVDEKNRSWCTSSGAVDHRAVTIEVASQRSHPYKVTDAAYKSLVKLCADICKRNGIKQLLWKGDKSLMGDVSKQNMVVHRWTANKACPGDYLYNLHGQIAKEVNEILNKEGDVLADMTRDEFNTILDAKVAEIKKALTPKNYKFIEDVPAWATDSVQKAIDNKIISGTGDENGKPALNISEDFLRTLVVLDRAGVFDAE